MNVRNAALTVSIVLNVVLVVLLAASRRGGGKHEKPTTPEEQGTLDHLTLQLRCGKGDTHACAEVDRLDVSGCEGGTGHSCTMLAISYETGQRRPKNPPEATRYYLRGCDLGDAAGCWYAGIRHLRGQGVPVDRDQAMVLLTKACDLGQENGCLDLGDAYAASTPADLPSAKKAWDRGCSLGYSAACDRAK